jgi:hypothetical protein
MSKPSRALPAKLWEVRSTASKGLGVFARLPIPRGTRIFSEPPLLALRTDQDSSHIYSSARLLPVVDRKGLLELSTYVTRELNIIRWIQALRYTMAEAWTKAVSRQPKQQLKGSEGEGTGLKEHVQVLSVFRNNAFHFGGEGGISQAVFRNISRINHSCVPNSQGNFHVGMGRFNVHATRDIAANEEVTVSYLPEHGALRESRMEKLRVGYGFECGCRACDMNGEAGQKFEHERKLVLQSMEAFSRQVAGDTALETSLDGGEVNTQSPIDNGKTGHEEDSEKSQLDLKATELTITEKLVEVLESEGIAGREVASL